MSAILMPNVVGLNYYMALLALQQSGVYVPVSVLDFNATDITVKWQKSTQTPGTVTDQSPAFGMLVGGNSSVTLTIAQFPFGGVIDSPPDWRQYIPPVVKPPANAPVILTNGPLPSATQSTAYSTTITASGGATPYVWSIQSATPNTGGWVSINSSTGVISGTPSTVENETVTVKVTDANNLTATKVYALSVVAGLVITTTSPLPSATQSSAYSATVTAAYGTPPYTWSLTSASPDTGSWIAVGASTGIVSGTPGTVETEIAIIKVTDSLGATASKSFTIVVATAPASLDYYIGPSGVDGNAGTVVSPWPITTLLNPASTFATATGITHRGLLAGKKVGLLPGTYSLSALVDTSHVNDENPILCVPSGTALSPTKIVSCNSSGVYTIGTATIDAGNTPGGTGGSGPWHYAPAIGQTYADTGNVTLDGLVVQNCNGACISFYGPYTGAGAAIVGITVQNCVSQGLVTTVSGNNPGLIRVIGVKNSTFTNNRLYNYLTTNAGDGVDHLYAILTFGTNNCAFTYNTIYNSIACGGIKLKGATGSNSANDNKNCTIAFNYIEIPYAGSFGIADFASTDATSVNSVHHNICWAAYPLVHGGINTSDEFTVADTSNIYSNTLYWPGAQSGNGFCYFGSVTAKGVNWWNNILFCVNPNTGYLADLAVTSPAIGNASNNCYSPSGILHNDIFYGPMTGANNWFSGSVKQTVPNWIALAPPVDVNSFASNPSLLGPASITSSGGPATFKLSGGPCVGTGLGGVNIGAWDGIVTQIGSTV
jgi:hypothetical protein